MKRINTEERMLIQACLSKQMNLSQIAKRLKRNKSTISREISHHLLIKEGFDERHCIHKNDYFVCNICPTRTGCNHMRKYYNFESADHESKEFASTSRAFTRIDGKFLKIINEILVSEIHELRQSLHHVYIANPILQKICSERTIRRLIYRGETKIRPHELRKYVVYKHEYRKEKEFQLRDIRVLIGRQYSDYLNFINTHKRMNVVQYDSVIGKLTDEFAILTITFPKYEFQFGLLIKKGDPKDVRRKITRLFNVLHGDKVNLIFPINLCDNGVEFSYFSDVEFGENGIKICRTYFANPYRATDKSECERYHEFIRYFIPKGKSLDFLTQEKLNWMFSQINSMVRKKLNDHAPYDLIRRRFGKAFLTTIGIERVNKKEININQIC